MTFLKPKLYDNQKKVIDIIESSDYFVNIFKLMHSEEPLENADAFRIHKPTAPSIFSYHNQFTAEYRNNSKLEIIDFAISAQGEIETNKKDAELLQNLFLRNGLNELIQSNLVTSLKKPNKSQSKTT